VRDNRHEPAAEDTPTNEADALRVVIADRDGTVQLDQTHTERRDVTLYTTTIAPDTLPDGVFRLSLQIIDRDAGVTKQTLDLGAVASPRNGMLLHRHADTGDE
jgi:hypothetical protein